MYVRLRSRRWVIDEDTLDLLSDDVVRGGESASGEALVEEPSSWGVEVEVGGVGNESASVGEKRGEGVDEKGERGGYGYERDDREQGVMGDEDEGDGESEGWMGVDYARNVNATNAMNEKNVRNVRNEKADRHSARSTAQVRSSSPIHEGTVTAGDSSPLAILSLHHSVLLQLSTMRLW